MPTIEERLQALEQENTTRKREHELLTIAVNALVSKEAFEKIQEQNGKLFDAINTHFKLNNERLGDIQTQLIEQDGKITGLQTEMRQRFTEQDGKITGLQTEMRQRFTEQDNTIAGLDNKVTALQTTQAEHTTLLQQILARLPEKSN